MEGAKSVAFKSRNRNAGGELNRGTKRFVGHNKRNGQFVNLSNGNLTLANLVYYKFSSYHD